MTSSGQILPNNMELQQTDFDNSPEWLRNWWIQQDAERERLRKLDAQYPGAPHPHPPSRPPKRPELRVELQSSHQV